MTSSPIKIIQVGPKDARIAWHILEKSWLAHYRNFMPLRELLPAAGAPFRNRIKSLTLSRTSHIFLAYYNSVAVGAIVILEHIDHTEVDELFILPGSTSKGIGSLLLEIALENARSRGVDLKLSAMADNKRARAFYEREGGTLFRRSRHGWGRNIYPVVVYRWQNPIGRKN
jgi:GNAT superfamily N-acetyltransferase